MKNIVAKTPQEVGLSIIVCSGPRGAVRDNDWPCIEWTVQIQDSRRKPVWTGEWRTGVGHVKVPKGMPFSVQHRLTGDEENLLMTWQSKPHAQFINKKRWADVAAKLAAMQKVTPKLEDVCHSLISDGAAFFDGQRFKEWAGNLGYDSDSIKAKETFDACDKVGRDLTRALSRDDIDSLREWASNY